MNDGTERGPALQPTKAAEDVVRHYDGCLDLSLSDGQVSDLVEYLKSL